MCLALNQRINMTKNNNQIIIIIITKELTKALRQEGYERLDCFGIYLFLHSLAPAIYKGALELITIDGFSSDQLF